MDDVFFTPLTEIETAGGNVWHALKATEPSYFGFGEAYFSSCDYQAVKAWKLHKFMTLNLIVIVGSIRFVLHDMREESVTRGQFAQYTLSLSNYGRLTVPPNIWFGFQGLADKRSVVLNIADICHDPSEVERKDVNEICFDWTVVK